MLKNVNGGEITLWSYVPHEMKRISKLVIYVQNNFSIQVEYLSQLSFLLTTMTHTLVILYATCTNLTTCQSTSNCHLPQLRLYISNHCIYVIICIHV